MKNPLSIPGAIVVVAVCIAASACGTEPVIGVLLAESGAAAEYGKAMRQGIELAIKHAREDGSYPDNLSLYWADSGTDPDTAAAELRRLANDHGVKLVIAGVTSGEARAMLPVLEDVQVVALSPSASLPALTKDSRLFFRVFSSDELEGRRAGRFLREDQDEDTVLIFSEDSEQARGIEPPFRQVFEQSMGGKVVGKVLLSAPDWESEAADLLLAHNPGSAYIIAYSDRTLDAVRLLRQKNFKGVICVSSSFYSGNVAENNADLLEGVYFPQPAFDTLDDRPIVQDFVEAFRAAYGNDPDIYAAHAYDAMRVALALIPEVPVFEANDVRKALLFSVKEFPGVTGIIQFNDYGDVHHNPIMFIIKDGQVRNYERWVEEEKKQIRERIKRLLKG